MTVRSKAELKKLFERGDRPTAEDFADLIDSLLSASGEDWPDPLFASSGRNLVEIAKEQVPNPWATVPGSVGYIDSRTVVKLGDCAALFPISVRVRISKASGFAYSEVTSVAYDGVSNGTTIQFLDAVVDNTVSVVEPSIFLPVSKGGPIGISALVSDIMLARKAVGLPPVFYGSDRRITSPAGGVVNSPTYWGYAYNVPKNVTEVIWGAGPSSKSTAAWAVGAGNGACIDGGACAANTWYTAWAIKRSDTGAEDAALTVNDKLLGPPYAVGSLPAVWDTFAFLGWVKTDGAGLIVPFALGTEPAGTPRYYWGSSFLDVSTTAPGTGVVTATLNAPPRSIAIVDVSISSPSLQTFCNVGSKNYTLAAPSSSACNLAVASGGVAAGQFLIPLDVNRQMRYQFSASNASLVITMRTLGWISNEWCTI